MGILGTAKAALAAVSGELTTLREQRKAKLARLSEIDGQVQALREAPITLPTVGADVVGGHFLVQNLFILRNIYGVFYVVFVGPVVRLVTAVRAHEFGAFFRLRQRAPKRFDWLCPAVVGPRPNHVDARHGQRSLHLPILRLESETVLLPARQLLGCKGPPVVQIGVCG